MKPKRLMKSRWLIPVALTALVVVGAAVKSPWQRAAPESTSAFFAVERRDLEITVRESGSVKALKKLEIKCEVEGQTTLLSLIPEGVYLTEEDVANKRVLVELDSSDTRDKITQQDITLQSAQASYTQAKESYDIQVNQNESNIKAGELDVKFSRMDLDKYLGAELAEGLVRDPANLMDLDKYLSAELAEELVRDPADLAGIEPAPRLKGEALQKLRKLSNDIGLAEEEVKRAVIQRDWTDELWEKKFVTRNELEADELALKRRKVELEQAQTELNIFKLYEFPKEVEQRLADYQEALKALERVKARARSELASAEAQLKSKEAAYRLQKERFDRLQEQLEASVIYATQPGLVVYATSGNPWHRQPPLEEGATVRQRQVLINIPDTSLMAAEIKVHEASFEKVKEGQKATITFEAYPDLRAEGHVHKVAMLPDAQHRWLNPDLKVYTTDIVIHGERKILRPGLSAEVEIQIDKLHDVLVAPIQAVVPEGENRVCYVLNNGGREKRIVEIGLASDEFIEVRSGLEAGEKVMLNPPRYGEGAEGTELQQPDAEEEGEEEEKDKDEDETSEEPGTKESESETGAEGDMLQQFENMSPEEKKKRMEQFKALPPEQRRKISEQLRGMGIKLPAKAGGKRRPRPAAGAGKEGAK